MNRGSNLPGLSPERIDSANALDPSGVFTLGHNSRLHHIGVGRRYCQPQT